MGVLVKMVIDILETAVQMAFRSGLTLQQVRAQITREFGGIIDESVINRIITKIMKELALLPTFFC